MLKSLTVYMDHNKLENSWSDIRPPYLPSESNSIQVKKQQFEWDVEQQTGLKLGKEYDKAVCCHSAYLNSTQSTSHTMHVQYATGEVCAGLRRFSHVNSLGHYGLLATRLLCPWVSPGKNIGVACHALLQGIFPTQGSNRVCLLNWQVSSLWLASPGEALCMSLRGLNTVDEMNSNICHNNYSPFICK